MSKSDAAQKQRTGYTTGSCAAAGARAALASVVRQRQVSDVTITLPKGGAITIPVECVRMSRDGATYSVTKDGGDDPDVTHGASIVVDLAFTDGSPGSIEIDGGEGVGVVTKPGLGLEIGRPAINPVPKKMIAQNLEEEAAGCATGGAAAKGGRKVAEDAGRGSAATSTAVMAGSGDVAQSQTNILEGRGIKVVISVPRGRELGPKTDNPRLGIIGGISILGTSGIVIPFSTASYAASIRQNLDVAAAMGEDTIVLTTGGRSEEFARDVIRSAGAGGDAGGKGGKRLPDHCFVQMGDFVGYSVRECAKRSEYFERVYVVGFVGKLAKMATGVRQTHVKGSKVNMKFLARLAADAGASGDVAESITRANTARHVAEIISGDGCAPRFFGMLCREVYRYMRGHAKSDDIAIEVVLFDFEGGILARASDGGPRLQ